MAEYVELIKADALPDGAMKRVSSGGRDYLVARAAGKYYCTDLRCPHMGGDLSKGRLAGTVIECPLHHSQFELSDGHVVRWAGGILGKLKGPASLKAYEVKVDGDRVLVRL